MKKHLTFLLLVGSLTNCGKKSADPAVTDPFLGHWHADSTHATQTDPTGAVTLDKEYTGLVADYDITPTIMTYSETSSFRLPGRSVRSYTRTGEKLLYVDSNASSGEIEYVRALTPTSFTYERQFNQLDGSKSIELTSFHR